MTEIPIVSYTDDLDYARIFELIATAKKASGMRLLRHVENLTNLALVQLVLDWEGVDAQSISDQNLEKLMRKKARLVAEISADYSCRVRRHDA